MGLDITSDFRGLYAIATFDNELVPHFNPSKHWETPGGEKSWGLIFMDDELNPIEVEGYAISSLT